jgi:hypothetical protein
MADAKRFLQQVKLYDSKINSLLEELDNLKAMVTKITTTLKQDVVSSGGNQDKLGDAVSKIVDLEAEINRAVDCFINRKKAVNDVLDMVYDPEQYAVLYKRYILYKRWEQIACEMSMTYRGVLYVHGRALQTVGAIMKGMEHGKE